MSRFWCRLRMACYGRPELGTHHFWLSPEGHSIIFDPNWANWHGPVKRQIEPGLHLNTLPELDFLLVSHAHFDHLHKKSLLEIDAGQGIVVPQGSGSLVKKLGFPNVTEMKVWEER